MRRGTKAEQTQTPRKKNALDGALCACEPRNAAKAIQRSAFNVFGAEIDKQNRNGIIGLRPLTDVSLPIRNEFRFFFVFFNPTRDEIAFGARNHGIRSSEMPKKMATNAPFDSPSALLPRPARLGSARLGPVNE